MKIIKKGDSGPEVHRLQTVLKLQQDGVFGPATEKAVIRFQLAYDLKPDGIVGPSTWERLMIGSTYQEEAIDEDTDNQSMIWQTNYDQTVHRYFLPKGEYLEGPVVNEYEFLHHTAGRHNPFKVVDHWGRDTRGRVATEFVLGGKCSSSGKDEYDGVMVQAFPVGGYGWHLGKTGSGHMNRHSTGIEICAFGYLKDGKTYVNTTVREDQIYTLKEPFRGYTQYHSYTDKQMEETEKWIKYIAERDGIDVRLGLKQWIQKYGPAKAFDFQEDAYYGKVKGLLTHTNVRRDKTDCYPDERLIDIILSL